MRLKTLLSGLAGLGLLVVAACRGDLPLGPGGVYALSLNVLGDSLTYSRATFSSDLLCYGEVEAEVAGLERLVWSKTVVRVFSGADRSVPTRVDTLPVSMFPMFRRPSVAVNQPDTAGLGGQMSLPGDREYVFHYRVNGVGREYAAAPLRVRCGPEIPADAAPPTVSLFGVPAPDTIFDVGDTITINYRLAAPAALLRSEIRLSGPFAVTRRTVEEFAAERDVTERFVVPRTLQSRVPLRVAVVAVDAAGRTVTLDTVTSAVPVDTSAPRIVSSTVSQGQLAVGSMLRATVTVRENAYNAWIIWEFDGEFAYRDSAAVNDGNAEFNYEVALLVPPAWAEKGARLRVWARDRAGNLSAPDTSDAAGYSFYETSPITPMLAAGYPMPPNATTPAAVVFDAARGRLYLSHPQVAKLSVVDAATGTQLANLDVPPLPGGMDLSLSGDSLFITQSTDRAIAVVDLNTLTLLAPITSSTLDSLAAAEPGNPPLPTGVRVAANGKLLVLLHRATASGHRVVELNPAAGTGLVRTEASGMTGFIWRWWSRAASSADRTRILLFDPACPRAYSSVSDTFSACGAPLPDEITSPDFETVTVSVDGATGRSQHGHRTFDPSLAPLATFLGSSATLMAGGEYAVVVRGDGLDKVRVTDGRIMRRLYLEGWSNLGRPIHVPGTQDWLLVGPQSYVVRVQLSDFY